MRHVPLSRSVAIVTGIALLAGLAPIGPAAAIGRSSAGTIRASGDVLLSETDEGAATSPAPAADPVASPAASPVPDGATNQDGATNHATNAVPSPAVADTAPAGPSAWSFAWGAGIRALGTGTNRLSAGGIKSIRFTLGGDQGLDILAPGFPVSQRYDCRTGRLIRLSRYRTRPFGDAGLTYDSSTSTYTYAWQTREEWSNTCRRFTIKLIDGTAHAASFRLDTFRFIAPTKRFPRVNNARPGATVPVAFHLGASARLDIWSGTTPRSRQVDCATDAPLGPWSATSPSGTAGLTRNAARQDYTYAWQTEAGWAQTCRAFQMRMKDGTVQQLRFRFNRPPKAIDDSGTGFVTEQSATFTTDNVFDNDTDPDGDPLSLAAVDDSGLTGSLTDNGDGTFDYDPGSSFDQLGQGESDTDSFGYTITDPSGATDSATVTITVNGLNDAPVIEDQNRSVAEDAADGANVGIPLTFNDPDATDTHTFAITAGNAGGAFAIDDTGQIAVADATQLDAGATPTYSLTVEVTDDASPSALDTATITVTVTDVNRTPVAKDASPTVVEDTKTQITLTATDADDDDLTFDVPSTSTNGATIDNPGTIDCTTTPKTCTRTYDYQPFAESNAADGFTFTVSDGVNTSDAGTVEITFTPVNDAPTLDTTKNLSLGTVSEDAPSPSGAVGVLVSSLVDFVVPAGQVDNVTDPDSGAQLGIAVFQFDVGNGRLWYSLNGGTSWTESGTRSRTNALLLAADSDNRVSFRPDKDVNGTTTFAIRFRAWDRTTGTDGETGVTVNTGGPTGAFSDAEEAVSLTITAVNDAPVVATTAGGITYDVGAAAQVIDSGLTVEDVDDTELEGALVRISVGFDKGNDELSAPLVLPGGITASWSMPAGELTLSGTASMADYQAALRLITFSNTAPTATTGTRTISFTVTDGDATSLEATRTVEVQIANTAPVAANHTLATSSGIRVTIGSDATGTLLVGATDDTDPTSDLRVSSTFTNVLPAGSVVTLIDAATGTYSFDPPGGYTGAGSFDYEICDDGLPTAPVKCDTGSVTVTIGGTDLWFVDDSAAAGGDGRMSAPYQSLASLPAGRGTGDRIFIFSGTYATGHTFLTNERLIGQGSTGSFDTLLGVVAPADGTLDTRPTLSGTAPTAGGTVFLAGGATLRGVAISTGTSTGLTEDWDSPMTGVDVSETSVATTTGTPLLLLNVDGTITLTDLDTSGAARGIDLRGVGAAVTIGSGATITNTSVTGIFVIGGTGALTYGGTVTVASGRAVQVQNRTGTTPGMVSIDGTVTATGGTGISLTGNTTGTIAFTGGIELSTGSNTAFSATGGGTVTATGTNKLTTTTATALNVENTTIGAAGLTFQSINVDGAAIGIVLNNTGSSGGLTVTGVATTDGTGGLIKNTTTRGASLISTKNVRLSNMQFTNAAGDGPSTPTDLSIGGNTGDNAAIHLQTVDGATLTNIDISGSLEHGINAHEVNNLVLRKSTISGIGQSADEDGIHAYNLKGTSTEISDTSITGSAGNNIRIENNTNLAGSFSPVGTIALSGVTLSGAVAANGIRVDVRGTNTTTLSLSGSTVTGNAQTGVVANGRDASTMRVTIGMSSITSNGTGISISGTNGLVDYDINNNTAIKLQDGIGISVVKAANSTGTMRGWIRNNLDMDTEAGVNFATIDVENRGSGALISVISNNDIDYAGGDVAIDLSTGEAGAGTLDATVQNNAIDLAGDPSDAFPDVISAIRGESGMSSPGGAGATLCANIGGVGVANAVTHSLGVVPTSGDLRLRQRFGNTVELPSYFGSSTSTANVVTYLAGRNTVITTPTATIETGAFVGVSPGCDLPPS